MLQRLKNGIQFQVERFVLRGPQYRLLVVAVLIAAIAVAAGLLVFGIGAAFPTVGEAIWWAFLRLTDPGYLGDDRGTLNRTVSTVLTVLGYVVFLGALVAIMTQWFHETMDRLQAGLTPIVQSGHILILGWTNRTPTILQELFRSEGRVERFLQRFGTRSLRVVLLSEEDPSVVVRELREHLGPLWQPRRLIIRSGSPLRLEHLRRVDFLNASVILLPAKEHPTALTATVDGDAIKTLITIADAARDEDQTSPFVVAETRDPRHLSIARRAHGGPIEVVPTDEFVSRILAQNLRHRGLSFVYSELLGHEWGNEIYLRECAALVGHRFGDVRSAFSKAIPVGIVRTHEGRLRPLLNPPADTSIEVGDRIVLIAEDYESAAADQDPTSLPMTSAEPRAARDASETVQRRVLVLGWNHRVPFVVREIDDYREENMEIDIISRTPASDRSELMDRLDVRPEHITLNHIEADFTSPSDLAEFSPARYDAVLLVASDWNETDASTDARSILGYLVLRELLAESSGTPHIVVEIIDPENARLFRNKPGEILVSPMLVSHVLTQVGLRRELRVVFEELFGPRGPEIRFRPLHEFIGDGGEVYFESIQAACAAHGEIALGLRIAESAAGSVQLNPDRSRAWRPSPADDVIVLAG